jgi:hypothetical protein
MACNFALFFWAVAAIGSLVALFFNVRMARAMNRRDRERREYWNERLAAMNERVRERRAYWNERTEP